MNYIVVKISWPRGMKITGVGWRRHCSIRRQKWPHQLLREPASSPRTSVTTVQNFTKGRCVRIWPGRTGNPDPLPRPVLVHRCCPRHPPRSDRCPHHARNGVNRNSIDSLLGAAVVYADEFIWGALQLHRFSIYKRWRVVVPFASCRCEEALRWAVFQPYRNY